MEIERKFLVNTIPPHLESYEMKYIEQAYLCTEPVIRVRRENDTYYLTYKGKGLMVREEYNLPLTHEAYEHLYKKADGNRITKKRYLIPIENNLTIELDIFEGRLSPLIIAEVEFPDEQTAMQFKMLDWFSEEVTTNPLYHNSNMIHS